MPSKPRITSRCENWLGGRRVRQADGCVRATPSATASTAANTATRDGSCPHGVAAIIATAAWCTLSSVRVLGIDYGRRRIGLALSDATGLLARPWKTIACAGDAARVAASLAAEIARARVRGRRTVGRRDRLSAPAQRRAEPSRPRRSKPIVTALRSLVDLPIVLQDERLTSREAESLLAQREKDWRKRKPLLDAASAAVILQDYLDGAAARAAAKPNLEIEDL